MLTLNDLNPNLLQAEYAVRGKLVDRAQELEKAGQKIIYCNIGNPHALGQIPLTYIRQTLALLEYPELLNSPSVASTFPSDIIETAQHILKTHPYGTGAYSQSTGIEFIRTAVARFITQRDDIPSNPDHIILTDGASKGVQAVIQTLLKNPQSGVMIPVPQYPLYSATLTLFGGHRINYLLDEEAEWSLNEENLESSIQQAKTQGIDPVAIAVINPGNPTGSILSQANIEMVISFAKRHNLAILADEVYQENIYHASHRFHSFAKVMYAMAEDSVALFSFHSVSKGFLGECGHRGGYVEFRNIPDEVLSQFVKLQSINLCANIAGQITTYLMVNPPVPGTESYPLYLQERDQILSSLHQRSEIIANGLNKIPGISLHTPRGAMYAFVRFELPEEPHIDQSTMSLEEIVSYHAHRNNQYCLALLEQTGICTVPGSGFGQTHGTYHFRLAFLPPLSEIETLVEKISRFHLEYIRQSA